MRPLTTDQIRQLYLDFFKEKGHAVISGAPLIPENDPTVLFTTAGMHPLVPYLMGEKHPAGKRLVDVQRCIRTGDIDEVGDSSHLTMFEMLGNWSLGDYFKEGAIQMSFEFLTNEKYLGIPKEMLAVTCFEGDSDAPKDLESAGFWKAVGIPEERIGFLPKSKNWWGPAGKTGPCGPDTEMFYWVGSAPLPPPGSNPANDDANWLEIWNDVFIQYNKKEDGTFDILKQQNVDTGMGLERVAKVLQGVSSVYETDRMKPIMLKINDISQVKFLSDETYNDQDPELNKKAQVYLIRQARIVLDHLKAGVFIIADGIKPSNIDQGYVLRRLIRRAIRAARKLAVPHEVSFSSLVAQVVIEQYSGAYPHLQKMEGIICSEFEMEEERFKKTINQALGVLRKKEVTFPGMDGGQPYYPKLTGAEGFDLFTTYGLPVEIVKEEAQERGIDLAANFDEEFSRLFEAHQTLSRAGAEKRFAGGLADHSAETTKLHTATHLLNAALRKVLGDHVWQKGSNVTAERLRFDFSHTAKMTPEEIKKVEELVNQAIKDDLPVSYSLMTVDEAKSQGAIGVFDEKYAERIKVYSMGNFSKEICGGPHVSHTGVLGSFKIQKEEAVSAGVRRLKAVVSGGPADITVATESTKSQAPNSK